TGRTDRARTDTDADQAAKDRANDQQSGRKPGLAGPLAGGLVQNPAGRAVRVPDQHLGRGEMDLHRAGPQRKDREMGTVEESEGDTGMSTEEFDLEAAAKELAEARAKVKAAKDRLAKRIKPDETRIKELEQQIALNAEPGDNLAGDWQEKMTPSKDLAKDKLAEAYPQKDFPNLWKTEILGGEVKKMIGENEYDVFRIPNGKATITITNVADED